MIEILREKLIELDTILTNAMALSVEHVEQGDTVRQVCDFTAVYSAHELVVDLLTSPPAKPDPQVVWDGLSEKERHVIEHALGGDAGHRNFYFTSIKDPVCSKLVDDGLAKRGRPCNADEDCYYHVTELGIDAFAKRAVDLRALEVRELLRRFTPVMHECFRVKRCEDLQTMRGLIRRRLVQVVVFDEASCVFTFEYSPKGRALAKHLQALRKKSPSKDVEALP